MIYSEVEPGKYQGLNILKIVYYEAYQPEHDKEKLIPDGTANLVIDLTDEPKFIYHNETLVPVKGFTRAWFAGIHTEYITISSGKNAKMMVVSFAPEGYRSLLTKPCYFYANKTVGATDVFGDQILSLRNELIEIGAPDEKINRLFKWLKAQCKADSKSSLRTDVTAHFIAHANEMSIKACVKTSGYSHRQFIKIFKDQVGITPKQYQKIVQFNDILSQIHQNHQVNWTVVAQDCGYFDQSHFIKDFNKFCGIKPSGYAAKETDWKNYLAAE